MKKFLALSLCLIMILTSFVLMSCDKGADDIETSAQTTVESTTEESTALEPVIPTGYKKYSNDDISFAYPSDWSITNGSSTIFKGTKNGNNITLVYEDKTDYYEKLTVQKFNSEMKPMYANMGMSVSNASVSQTSNGTGLKITKIAFNNAMSGTTIKQTQFITTVGNKTYTITVSEFVSDSTLVNNVFNSIAPATSTGSESSEETSEETSVETLVDYSNAPTSVLGTGYVSVFFPAYWEAKMVDGKLTVIGENGASISYVEQELDHLDTFYKNLTIEDFRSTLKPELEASGLSISGETVKRVTNSNGIKMTKIQYNAAIQGVQTVQTTYAISIENDWYVYLITLTQPANKQNPSLDDLVFNGITDDPFNDRW